MELKCKHCLQHILWTLYRPTKQEKPLSPHLPLYTRMIIFPELPNNQSETVVQASNPIPVYKYWHQQGMAHPSKWLYWPNCITELKSIHVGLPEAENPNSHAKLVKHRETDICRPCNVNSAKGRGQKAGCGKSLNIPYLMVLPIVVKWFTSKCQNHNDRPFPGSVLTQNSPLFPAVTGSSHNRHFPPGLLLPEDTIPLSICVTWKAPLNPIFLNHWYYHFALTLRWWAIVVWSKKYRSLALLHG